MNVAKVFQSGSDRAIRLPDEFRVDADEVYLRRTPDGFLVTPRDPWEVFYEGVEELSDGFFREGRVQPPVEQRDWKP